MPPFAELISGQRWRDLGSRCARAAELGVDRAAEPELKRRLRVFSTVSVATIAIGIPFVFQYWSLGVPEMSVAISASIASGIANLWWVSRHHDPKIGGLVGTCILFVLLLLSNWSSGGFYDPNFAWLYVIPLYASLMIDARAGWIFTGVVLFVTALFWLAPDLGIEVPNYIPEELRPRQSLANRMSAIIGIGVMLGALASKHHFINSLLRSANADLRKEMDQRQVMTDQLLAAERRASVGTLAASLGHEVNNPLSYVIGNLEFIQHRIAGADSDLSEAIGDALAGADKVRLLISDLRTFAAEPHEGLEPIDLRECVDRAVGAAVRKHPALGQIQIEQDGALTVTGNGPRLRQVFAILLANAAGANAAAVAFAFRCRKFLAS